MARLARYSSFLHTHPSIRIHIRTTEKFARKERYIAGGVALRRRVLALLGIDPARLVSGSVLADRIYVPTAAVCNSQSAHALELRQLARLMVARAYACGVEGKVEEDGFSIPVQVDSMAVDYSPVIKVYIYSYACIYANTSKYAFVCVMCVCVCMFS